MADPKYAYLRRQILADIESGKYAPGERIPSDNVLMRQFNMSKSTVTKALDLLVQDGVVYREQGRGSFVRGGRSRTRLKCFLCPMGPAEERFWRELIDRFNESNAGFEVVPQFTDDSAVSLRDTLYAAFASGKAPDIVALDGPDVPYWAHFKAIRPLDGYMTPAFTGRFLHSILKQGTYNGSVYHLGYNESTLCLLYNKALMQALSIEVPRKVEDAWTWDELLRHCETIRKKSGVPYPLLINSGKGMERERGEWVTYFGLSFLGQNGAVPFDEAATTTGGYLNSPASISALEWAGRLFHKHNYAHIEKQDDTSFPDDFALSFSMQNHYMALSSRCREEQVGILPLPKRLRVATPHGGWGLSICTQTRHPDLCWTFLEYVFSLENQLKLSKITGMPVLKDIYDIYEDLGAASAGNNILYAQLQQCSITRPITPAYPYFSQMFADAFLKTAHGEPARKALDDASHQVDGHIRRHRHFTEPQI